MDVCQQLTAAVMGPAAFVPSWVWPYVTSVNGVLLAVALWALWITLVPGPRRKPTRPPVSEKRTYQRGSGDLIDCVNPATGERLGEARAYTPDEVRLAYRNAKAAADQWAQVDFTERRAVLMDIMDWVVDNMEDIAQWSCIESGKTLTEATLGEVMVTCEKIRWIVAHGEKCLLPEERPVPSLLLTKRARVEYYPYGVIGVIVPWNYPVHNVLSAVVSALFAGNGALVKVSEFTSWTAERLEDMFRRTLARRGHNPDLVQIVTGYGKTGEALVRSGVEKILFIGSPAVGRLVMAGAAHSLTPVILELGGKDPFIVFDDANLAQVVDVAVRGAFINCGQNCVSAERFYVQDGVYDRFVRAVADRMALVAQGASCTGKRCDFGAMTMPAQADHVEALVKEAVAQGARMVCGGRKHDGSKDIAGKAARGAGAGVFYAPTVLADVTHGMRIANEEAFGPVMTVIRFRGEEEVVRMANSTAYALGCSIFTRDYKKADRVTKQIVAGMVTVNDFAMVPVIQSLPFGGTKDSGFGHFNGQEGLRGFSRVRAVVTDRFPLQIEAPKFLQYPMWANAHEIAAAGIRMVYGRNLLHSAAALLRMLRLLVAGAPSRPTVKKD